MFIISTTIGYGDIHLVNYFGKVFTMLVTLNRWFIN
ncbi:hypothetical protein B9D04_04015 [Weissella cibaria]|uniref:Potassium channel domain-containing protein n=1 Tax=Weissella cibaria TaxID=137591 RepID=A0A1X4JML6_9LACO|nr:hypothetical protein [Weissella cibaria]OSP89971.1 hypothetical protein B9D04_04015 [Weissella cibaria]